LAAQEPAKESFCGALITMWLDHDLDHVAVLIHGTPQILLLVANLRVLEVKEIKTVPHLPLSHPFVERLIGTIRREYLDRTLFWTTADLEAKLIDFQNYYNGHRTHSGLQGHLPEPTADGSASPLALDSYRWQRHCRAWRPLARGPY
jgi:hypothetical protein